RGQNRVLSGGLQPRVIPAAASAAMSSRCTDEEMSTKFDDSGTSISRALARNEAICPRVTGWVGQNRSFFGGLHPTVIPAAANASISAAWIDSAVSTNFPPDAGGRPKARTKKEAISWRVTGCFGQKRSLAGGLQPRVMPAAAKPLMSC